MSGIPRRSLLVGGATAASVLVIGRPALATSHADEPGAEVVVRWNQELLRIRKRTRDGMRQAQTSGRYLGRSPFGYLNSKDKQHKSILLVDDKKAVVVQQIFQEYI